MGKGTECSVVTVQPAVAEATQDRAPPIRVSMGHPVLIKSKEYQMLSGAPIVSDTRHGEFSDGDLPLHMGSDTMVLGEKEQQSMLPVIASVDEPVMIESVDDFPNQVANPSTIGRDEKEKARRAQEDYREQIREELRDPKVLDVLSRLINLPNRNTLRIAPRSLDATSQGGKQCGGGTTSSKGSQTETNTSQSSQGGFVTGCSGRSSLVVGCGGGGGGGLGGAGGGGDDRDPNRYRPYNVPPSHYTDFTGTEEQVEFDAERNAALAILAEGMVVGNNPLLSQFNNTHEEPMSASLDGLRPNDLIEGMDFDLFSDAAQYLCGQEPMFQVAPAEETSGSPGAFQLAQPASDAVGVVEESPSDIKDSFDLIHLMKPSTQHSRPQGQMIGITPETSSIPRSQIPGLTQSTSYPAPIPSPAPTNMPPSPCPPLTPLAPLTPVAPLTPMTPATPAPTPSPLPTPSTPQPQPQGFFLLKTFVEEDKRVCELGITPNIPPDKLNTAYRAMLYINDFYMSVLNCSETGMDLKVANDVNAKMCSMQMECSSTLKVSFSMPKDCKPLAKWLTQNSDLKDGLLVLQQVLNTLATIHTLGYENDLSLWGSFMVWVANDLRVYLLVDFPMLLQRQQDMMGFENGPIHPRNMDVKAVCDIYHKVVLPSIGRDGSWVSPALRNSLLSFESVLSDTSSSCRVAEAARILGEKRVCKVDVDLALSVVFYCLEREELQTALRELSHIAPSRIATMWMIKSVISGHYMRVGDIATADRPMHLSLEPCMHPVDTRLLYIVCK